MKSIFKKITVFLFVASGQRCVIRGTFQCLGKYLTMTNNVLQEVHRNTQNDTNVQNPLGWCDINHIAPERLPQTLDRVIYGLQSPV